MFIFTSESSWCRSLSLPHEGASPLFSYKSAPASNNRIPETIWRRGVSSRCLVFFCRSPCSEYGRKTPNVQFPSSINHGNRENPWTEDQKITNARNMTTNGHFNSRESRNGCYPVPQTACYHRGDLRSRDVPCNCAKLWLGKCMGRLLWNKGGNKVWCDLLNWFGTTDTDSQYTDSTVSWCFLLEENSNAKVNARPLI